MRLRRILVTASVTTALVALTLGAVFVRGAAAAPASSASSSHGRYSFIHACAAPSNAYAACNAILRVDNVAPHASSPGGYNPPDLQAAYNLPSSTAGSGQTVAIVDAYDDPNAESDLGVYRSTFGLPACPPARLHDRQRLLQEGEPVRRHEDAPRQWRLGAGDLARPRHGQRGLPELPHHPGRGLLS